MSEEFRAFWAVVPATVLDDMSLPANAKILYGVLSSLMRREGYCWPSNAQLAEAMHCSEDVIRRWLAALQRDGHIQVSVLPNRKTGGSIRYISPVLTQPTIVDDDEGYRDEQPGTYRDKNTGVPGQTSRSLYKDGYKKENKKKKKKEKENPLAAFAAASSLLSRCEAYGHEVTEAMQRFLYMREELKKPIKSGQSATMLWNKLVSLSGGSAPHMAALLDKATECQWLSLYQLKDDELARLKPETPQAGDGGTVDLSGLRFV